MCNLNKRIRVILHGSYTIRYYSSTQIWRRGKSNVRHRGEQGKHVDLKIKSKYHF